MLTNICDEMYNLRGGMLSFYDICNINKDIFTIEIEVLFMLNNFLEFLYFNGSFWIVSIIKVFCP